MNTLLRAFVCVLACCLPGLAQVSGSTSFYLPVLQGPNSSQVGLAISNPTTAAVTVSLTARGYDGLALTGAGITNPTTLNIPASGQRSALTTEIFGAGIANRAGWAEISSPVSTITGTVAFFDPALTFVDTAELQKTTSPRIVFPKVHFGTTSSTTLVLINASSTASAQLEVSYVATSGELTSLRQTPVLPAGGGLSIPISGLYSGNAEWDGYAVVQAVSGNIVGFETYRNLSDFAALNATPESTLMTTGYIPHLATQAGYVTTLSLLNTTSTTQTVRITADALEKNGAPNVPSTVTITRTMSANSAVIEPVSSLFGLTGSDLITGFVKWEVQNDTQGVIGLVDYGTSNGTILAAVPGQSEAMSDLLFSHVAQGAGYYTGLAFLNPNASAVSVDVRIFDRNGVQTAFAPLSIAAGARTARLLTELVPSLGEQLGGYIHATSSLPVFAFELFGSSNGARFLANVPAHEVEVPPQLSGQMVEASQGATVYTQNLQASLLVPPGALSQNTVVNLVVSDVNSLPDPANQEIVSIVQGLPSGTTFNIPATLTFPLAVAMAPGTVIPILIYEPNGGTFASTEFLAVVDNTGRAASAQVTHFTTFVLAVPINNPVAITAISPGRAREGDAVAITGTGFSSSLTGNVVLFSGASVPVQAQVVAASATSLLVIVPTGARTGTVTVRVNSFTSSAITFEVLATPVAPLIEQLSPERLYVGVAGQPTSVEITGSNFRADSTVTFNDTARPFTFISSTRLSMELPGPLRIGGNEITVRNPGGTSSNTKSLTLEFTTPNITSLSPSTVPAGTATEVTIRGTGFIENSIVMLDNGYELPKRFVDSTTMVVTTPTWGYSVYYNLFIIQVAPSFGPQSNKVRLTFTAPSGPPARVSMGVLPRVPVNSEASIGLSIYDANYQFVNTATNPITLTITFNGIEVSRQVVTPVNGGILVKFTPTAEGRYSLSATATGLTSATAFFDATEDAHLTIVSGNNQTAQVDTVLPAPLKVRLSDSADRPLAGKSVAFAPFNSPVLREYRTTDANGEAELSYRMTTGAGNLTVTATYSLSTVTFALTSTPGPPANFSMEWLYLDFENNYQVGRDRFFHLFVTDQFYNRLTLDPSKVTLQASPSATLTYPGSTINGYPTGTFRPATYGSHTLTFRYDGVATPYTTTVDVVPAATPARLLIVSGNNQTGVYNSLLPTPFRVVVVDASNNPIPGVAISFTWPYGGSVSSASVVSDGSGIAEVQARLGNDVGEQTFGVSTASNIRASFRATSLPGPAARISVDWNAGVGSIIAGVTDVTFTVRLMDQNSHLVTAESPNLDITFNNPAALPSWISDTGWLGGIRKKTMRFGSAGQFTASVTAGAIAWSEQNYFFVDYVRPVRVKIDASATTVTAGQSVTFTTWMENQLGQITQETPTWFLTTYFEPGVPLNWTPTSLTQTDGVIRATFTFATSGRYLFKSRYGGQYFAEWLITVN
jgi:hypothetical protein